MVLRRWLLLFGGGCEGESEEEEEEEEEGEIETETGERREEEEEEEEEEEGGGTDGEKSELLHFPLHNRWSELYLSDRRVEERAGLPLQRSRRVRGRRVRGRQ